MMRSAAFRNVRDFKNEELSKFWLGLTVIAGLAVAGCDNTTITTTVRSSDQGACRRLNGAQLNQLSLTCVGGESLAVVGQTAEAQGASRSVEAAAALFDNYFRDRPRLTVVALGDVSQQLVRREFRERETARLFWVARADADRKLRAALETHVDQRFRHLPQTARRAIVDQAVDRARGASVGPAGDETLRHELGHLWLGHDMSPNHTVSPSGDEGSYGTHLPDWFDEIGALLTESESGRRARLSEFRRHVTTTPQEVDLSFLSVRHPHLTRASEKSGEEGEVSVSVIQSRRPSDQGGPGSTYYAEVSAFAAFLEERSGSKAIFEHLRTRLSAGTTFRAWLGSYGREFGLPVSEQDLQAQFRDWATSNAKISIAQP